MEISVGMGEHKWSLREAQKRSRGPNKALAAASASQLFACGSGGLGLRARRFETKNRFAFLHEIKAIARDRFEVTDVRLEQIDLARLARQQRLLLIDLLLEVVDLSATLHQFFIRRHKQTHDHQPDRYDQQNEENPIQSLPDGGFATRAEISVTVLHFSGL
jgi:hypothetical protein